ncbi:MAG: hypothetical protein QOG56_2704 [Solirubrobacteraceae bacterium]|nr:hypothetical protein [Solirubrobacteraceae bacterium]
MSELCGTGTVADVVYVLVGIAALMCIPRMLEGTRTQIPGTHSRPHGA